MTASAKIAALEIDDREVRAVVVKTGGKRTTVLERAAAPIRAEEADDRFEALVAAIGEAVNGLKFRSAPFVLCAPMAWAVVRTLVLPFRGRQRVVAAVPFELEPNLAVPLDELVIDSITTREAAGETEVLAVGLRHELLAEQAAACEAAGVYVESIGLDAAGLTALWQSSGKAGGALQAVVHVRESGSCLIVLYNKRLAYLRALPLTADQAHDDPAAAARSLRTAIRAFRASWRGEEALAGLALTGLDLPEANRRVFEEEAGLPIAYAAPETLLAGLDGEPGDGSNWDRWAAAAGVAAAAVKPAAERLEFRTGALKAAGFLPGLVSHLVFSAALLLIVVGGLGAYGLIAYRGNMQATERLAQQIWELYAETFPEAAAQGRPPNDVGGVRTFTLMEEGIRTRTGGDAGFAPELFAKPPFLDLLREVARVLPDSKAAVTEIRLETRLTHGSRSEVNIAGIVKESGTFGTVVDDLEASELLDFNPSTGLTRSLEGNLETFVVRAGI